MASQKKIREAFDEIVQETAELVRQSARGKQKVVRVSPEVAEKLNTVAAAPVAKKAPRPSPETRPPSPDSSLQTPDSAKPQPPTPKPQPAASRRVICERPDLKEARTLTQLQAVIQSCNRCPLGGTRTKLVFGEGNPNATLVFVGEAPGFEEDQQGRPFVGRAGKLLTDIIEKGFKIPREEVYICNVLKCRPPENRNPLLSEIEECEPYLIRQLEIIQPQIICALGTFAAQTLLKTKEPIGRLRGRWHFYHGIPLRATYHPAYLLRNPADKVKTWDDVKEILRVYHGEYVPKPE